MWGLSQVDDSTVIHSFAHKDDLAATEPTSVYPSSSCVVVDGGGARTLKLRFYDVRTCCDANSHNLQFPTPLGVVGLAGWSWLHTRTTRTLGLAHWLAEVGRYAGGEESGFYRDD